MNQMIAWAYELSGLTLGPKFYTIPPRGRGPRNGGTVDGQDYLTTMFEQKRWAVHNGYSSGDKSYRSELHRFEATKSKEKLAVNKPGML